jgi:hypothetical protein
MFRLLARTIVILVAAAAGAAVLYLAVGPRGSSSPQERRTAQGLADRGGQARSALARQGASDGSSPSLEDHAARRHGGRWNRGRPDGGGWDGWTPGRDGRRGHEEASIGRGVGGMLVTALQVGLVGAVVVGIQTHARRRERRRREQERGE